MRKKSAAVIIIAGALALTSCGKPEPVNSAAQETVQAQESRSLETVSVDAETEREKETEGSGEQEVPAPVSQQVEEGSQINRGSWAEQTYTYADFSITVPNEWIKYTEEELKEFEEFAESEGTGLSWLMFSMDPLTGDNIIVMTADIKEAMPSDSETLDEAAYLDILKMWYGQDEGEELEQEIRELSMGGKTYQYLTEQYDSDGVSMTQYHAIRKIGDEIVMLAFCGDRDCSIETFAAMVSAAD